MLKHLFKLIWKRKKMNALMMFEIFFSFLILFAVWTLGIYNYRNYAQPSGLETDNVWVTFIDFHAPNDTIKAQYKDLIRQQMTRYKEVKSFSFTSSNAPFTFSSMNNSLEYNKKKTMSEMMSVEPDFLNVMGMKMAEGRWFTDADKVTAYRPIVITRHLKEELFGNENALGKTLGNGDGPGSNDPKMKVIGVIDFFKHKDDFQPLSNCTFQLAGKWEDNMLMKVQEGSGAELEAKISKEIAHLGKDWSVEIQQMNNMKSNRNNLVLVPVLILLIVCSFLVFNVALGLFGVLFQTISRRKQEIGVRRAMGATQSAILWHFIGETAVIATFGLILGIFFAVQFPILNVFDVEASVYLTGILLAVISIYILVTICAFYPSRQASVLQPAAVLHEE
ncbi:MAG: FtsX-like permease family protein [Spirosomataceae bacterium]